ncbi:hypothetical protein K1719_005654 [Acacia pycnantha]|nr:hypothetical protein K1719_005654 [Acacia pycnantha]
MQRTSTKLHGVRINSQQHQPPALDTKEMNYVVEVDGAFSHFLGKIVCGGVLKGGGNSVRRFMFRLEEGEYLTAELWVSFISSVQKRSSGMEMRLKGVEGRNMIHLQALLIQPDKAIFLKKLARKLLLKGVPTLTMRQVF